MRLLPQGACSCGHGVSWSCMGDVPVCVGSVVSLSGHIYISVHGSCLTYFINPQWYLPTTQKKEIKESITMMPGLVRISNRVFWVSR